VLERLKKVALSAPLALIVLLVTSVPALAFDGASDPAIDRLGSATQSVTLSLLGWSLAPVMLGLAVMAGGAWVLIKRRETL
jgi:LPXTG-motif cell wall-anchored protein